MFWNHRSCVQWKHKSLDKVFALVIRDGRTKKIEARELVPGDVLALEAGDVVPADARLMSLAHLEVNESALTGESVPVVKNADEVLDADIVLGDRVNMVFKGTAVSGGNARAIVTNTGANTEMGAISKMVDQAQKEEIPLNIKLNVFSKKLIWLTILIIIPFVVVGLTRGNDAYLMIETAIALAVAAIPEGLPIVATISLARGTLKLAKSNVIVKKLAAVETLGETNVILTDKTGTLTENRLKVEKLELANTQGNEAAFSNFLTTALLCNNAFMDESGQSIGDPVETALLKYVHSYDNSLIERTSAIWSEVDEKPFDSVSRYMMSLQKGKDGYFVAVKGSPTEVLDLCGYTDDEKHSVLDQKMHKYWVNKTGELARDGLKVLGFAYKQLNDPTDDYAQSLTFIGLAGFLDPPRAEVKQSILESQEAGIKIVMVTGDHPETAKAIARQVNLVPEGVAVNVIHGKDLSIESFDENQEIIDQTHIFSRVTPEQKLKLVSYFQNKGFVVAMTGDGVNDAPALKKSDIGIAMGIEGTQVAEEAADMVLQDDSFASIVKAIKQGRIIFENIKNFIIYLLSCNLTEVMVVAIAAFSNVSSPLLPLQILFLNIVTDVFPALALGMGAGGHDIMKHRSRNMNEPILNHKNWAAIVIYSGVMTLSIMTLFYYSIFYLEHDAVTSNNIAFFTLAFAQLWHPFNLIGRRDHLIRNEIVQNKYLWSAILFCVGLLAAAYAMPALNEVLQLTSLSLDVWTYIMIASMLPLVIIKILKEMKWVG